MLATHVKRGVLAGVVAGLVFGLFLALVASPLIAVAEGHGHDGGHAGEEPEDGHEGAHAADHGPAQHGSAVPATVATAASVLGGVLWGVLLGGVVFGPVYYFLEPAIPGTGDAKSYVLAAAGFVTVSGAPWLVLPPRPPGVEATLSTDTRILLYGGAMVAGALACLFAGIAYRRLRASRGPLAGAVGGALALAPLATLTLLSPAPSPASSLSPDLATGLTGTVVFGQVLLWLLLAGSHARLRSRPPADGKTEGATVSSGPPVSAD